VPKAITVDNGTQFDAETFKDFCDRIGTRIHFASVRHPESNGLVERANGIIMTGIMKLIFNQPRGKWPDKLIKVVWSHNTTGSIRTTSSTEDETNSQITKDTIEGTRL
jgi:transposase InsO family protein